MCETHEDPTGIDEPAGVRRRDVLRAGALGATALVLRTRPAAAAGAPISMAMHVHGSFSEGGGSWDAQLAQADANDVDVVWATDHDWRMAGRGFLTGLSLTRVEENGVRLVRLSGGGDVGATGLRLTDGDFGLHWPNVMGQSRGSLSGLVVGIDAEPDPGKALRLRIGTSRHPGFGDRPSTVECVITRAGRTTWRPVDTLARRLGPALSRDNAFLSLSLAGSGTLRQLTLDWNLADDPLARHRAVLDGVRSRHRAKVYQALEPSWYAPHVNWFGGDLAIPSFPDGPHGVERPEVVRDIVSQIHRRGGIASYNHPFGTEMGPAAAGSKRSVVAQRLVSTRALGCDLLEVAYPRRGGTIEDHLAVWDACSRNGIFLVGTGVSDDHSGRDWLAQPNRFVTCAWARSAAQPDLLAAIRSGRLFARKLGAWSGSMDMSADGRPMGSSSAGSATRRVRVQVDRVPVGGRVRLQAGPIDRGGTATVPIRTVQAWRGSAVDSTVPVRAGSFIRAEVLDAAGAIVGVGNPCWLPRA